MNLAITPAQARSKPYQKALRYELFSGRVTNMDSLKATGNAHPAILAYKGRILGGKENVTGYADWTEFLLARYGARKRCLSLGSGVGRVEKFLMKIDFAPGFDAIDLAASENDSFKIDASRAKVLSGDLNFVELPENTYDFILCHGVLHHLINLEFILAEINKALTPDGIFVAYEYIGEARWQFTEERMGFLRKQFPRLEFHVPKPWRVRGFESVRSDDLMGTMDRQFGDRGEKLVLFGGVYFPFVICTSRYSDQDVRRAVELDEEASLGGKLPPCYCTAIYRKSTQAAAVAQPWTDEDVRRRLAPDEALADRMMSGLRQSFVGSAIRPLKRAIFG